MAARKFTPEEHLKSLRRRLWGSVDKTGPNGCWIFTGDAYSNGYGRIYSQGRQWAAHRVSWMLTKGDPGSLCVLHKCDTRRCVRPGHLFLGTYLDNNRDMAAKQRNQRGDLHWTRRCPQRHEHGRRLAHWAKLTDDAVRAIRADARPQSQIARSYHINQAAVSRIRARRAYAFVEERP